MRDAGSGGGGPDLVSRLTSLGMDACLVLAASAAAIISPGDALSGRRTALALAFMFAFYALFTMVHRGLHSKTKSWDEGWPGKYSVGWIVLHVVPFNICLGCGLQTVSSGHLLWEFQRSDWIAAATLSLSIMVGSLFARAVSSRRRA